MELKDTVILANRPEKHFVGSFYFKKIKEGIDLALEGSEYQIFLSQQDKFFPNILSSKKSKIAGIIVLHPNIEDESVRLLEKNVGRNEFQSMLINCHSKKLSWVDLDNVHGAMTMTEHLIKLGHEKILFVGGFHESQNTVDRYLGFKRALEKHKIEFNPKLMITCDFSITLAYERMKEFLQINKNNFTAIFASNDLMAIGAIRALIDEKIKVPEDIAVVGFDDFAFASSFYIPLTTYKQPFKNLGFVAARNLIKNINNRNHHHTETEMIGEIVVRDSCGAHKNL
ncbi:LacI family DNA-binding transcriptional regulator [Elusimicrobiota bacterium]